jgi:MFS family permease
VSVAAAVRRLAAGHGYRRLLAVRLAGQCGDGVFEISLGSLFFFNATHESTPGRVAAAFAVLLLPYTIVGPWVGVLLDRWRRRQVLLVGYGLRAIGAVGVATLAATGSEGLPLYIAVLACIGVDRFLLAALSAGLPHVVESGDLITANSITPTLGTIAYAVGGAITLGLRLLDVPDAGLLLASAGLLALAAALARLIGADDLGPDERASLADGWRSVSRGLAQGVQHVWERRGPAYALGAIGGARFLFGVVTIASLLLCRNTLADPADTRRGLALLSVVGVAGGAGFAAAVVITPFVTQRMSPQRWIPLCLLIAAFAQAALALGTWFPGLLAVAFVLGLSAQGVKICVDTILQAEVADGFRGRVFTVYDMVFNAVFVAAAAIAGLVLPIGGFSRPVFLALAVGYLALAAAYARLTPHTGQPS